MPCTTPANMMPPGLEDFPWADDLHMWSYDGPYYGTRIRLWFPCREGQTAQQYLQDSTDRHVTVWKWLEERYEIRAIPVLTLEGDTSWRGPAEYRRLGAFSEFIIGSRR